ncbi:hypothetical protein A2335_03215 [Candidatus Peregrinibacteria bacterium RIFOXYB2_FULL_32_7]|nr:MAG: hypothetical protein A2335_03215 [Candidatus Peregrinibacteria bacterium RIFOXYB2_FULL_32_7]
MKKIFISLLFFTFILPACADKNEQLDLNEPDDLIDSQVDVESGAAFDIRTEIEKANYCEVKEDCARVTQKCPFGCNEYVNKDEKERIDELVNNFESDCVYRCAFYEELECKDNKCVAVYDK